MPGRHVQRVVFVHRQCVYVGTGLCQRGYDRGAVAESGRDVYGSQAVGVTGS